MSNVAIVLGAGSGTRMKSDKNKMLLNLMGEPVIKRSVEAFLQTPCIDEIIVTARDEELDEYIELFGNDLTVSFVIGGATRQQSVRNAVRMIDEADYIIIHDGARPLIEKENIEKTIQAAKECGAAAVGVPVKDTIKIINSDKYVVETPDRASLFAVQTPQVFSFELYKKALEAAEKNGRDYTDDCQLVEAIGGKVAMWKYLTIRVF